MRDEEGRKVGVTQDAQNQLEVHMTHLYRWCLSQILTRISAGL